MPPKKKRKLLPNSQSASPQTSSEKNDRAVRAARRAARRAAHLAARQSAREDFDPPFNIDEDADNFDSGEGSDDSDDSDDEEEVRRCEEIIDCEDPVTRLNTLLNSGYETAEGLQVARDHPSRRQHTGGLLTRARAKNPGLALGSAGTLQDSLADQDAPSEPVGAEE